MIWKLPDILQYMEHVLFFFFLNKTDSKYIW